MKNRYIIWITIIIIAVFVTYFVASSLNTEYFNKPIVKDKIENKDYTGLYNFYTESNPNLNERAYYGSENASITLLSFIDLTAESSIYFFNEIFPVIEKEYINTGKIRFYHKSYVLSTDIAEKNERYLRSKVLSCVHDIKKEEYYNVLFDMIQIEENKEIGSIIAKNNIPSEKFINCLDSEPSSNMKEGVSEVYHMGMVGINPRIYIGIQGTGNTIINGIPKIDKIKRVIKTQEMIIGA